MKMLRAHGGEGMRAHASFLGSPAPSSAAGAARGASWLWLKSMLSGAPGAPLTPVIMYAKL